MECNVFLFRKRNLAFSAFTAFNYFARQMLGIITCEYSWKICSFVLPKNMVSLSSGAWIIDYLYSDSMFVPNKIVSSNFFCMWISLAYQLDEVKLDNAQNFKLTGGPVRFVEKTSRNTVPVDLLWKKNTVPARKTSWKRRIIREANRAKWERRGAPWMLGSYFGRRLVSNEWVDNG